MKKVIRITGCIILVCISIIIYISYIEDKNENDLKNIEKDIRKNYQTTGKINYTNQYGNYYIIKTDSEVIILSKDYKEVAKESLSKLSKTPDTEELIYKTNKIMYEKTIRTNKKVIYEYYDAISGKKVKTTTLELK